MPKHYLCFAARSFRFHILSTQMQIIQTKHMNVVNSFAMIFMIIMRDGVVSSSKNFFPCSSSVHLEAMITSVSRGLSQFARGQ